MICACFAFHDTRIGLIVSAYFVFCVVLFSDTFPQVYRVKIASAACLVLIWGVPGLALALVLDIYPDVHKYHFDFGMFRYSNVDLCLVFAGQLCVLLLNFFFRIIKQPDSFMLLRSDM